jgi:hypothetical protein
MFWATVLTGGSLAASAQLAAVVFLGVVIFLGFNWRSTVVAVIAVVGVNVIYPGGAYRVVSAALLPLRILNANVAGCQKAAMEEERQRHYP